MVESYSDVPFLNLRQEPYLIIEILIFIDREEVLKFIFSINNKMRDFLKDHFIKIKNAFINNGRIVNCFNSSFRSIFLTYQ